jgi:hypothetical protein
MSAGASCGKGGLKVTTPATGFDRTFCTGISIPLTSLKLINLLKIRETTAPTMVNVTVIIRANVNLFLFMRVFQIFPLSDFKLLIPSLIQF